MQAALREGGSGPGSPEGLALLAAACSSISWPKSGDCPWSARQVVGPAPRRGPLLIHMHAPFPVGKCLCRQGNARQCVDNNGKPTCVLQLGNTNPLIGPFNQYSPGGACELLAERRRDAASRLGIMQSVAGGCCQPHGGVDICKVELCWLRVLAACPLLTCRLPQRIQGLQRPGQRWLR